jgi:hypothetical protein
MVGVFAVYIAAHATGIGQAVDIGMLIAGGIFFGLDAFTIFKDLAGFAGAINATTEEELDIAGEHLASAVAKIGVDALMTLLTSKVADEIGKGIDNVNQVDEVHAHSEGANPPLEPEGAGGNTEQPKLAEELDSVNQDVTGQPKSAIEGANNVSPGQVNQPQSNQPSSTSTTPKDSVPLGRVVEPGGQPDKLKTFKDNTQVPDKYKNDPRFNDLATDPDQGFQVKPNTRAEAMAGLEAESQGLVPGPIKRGPTGTEFYDAQGRPWDVKAPPSPTSKAKWKFKPEQSGGSIKEELSKKATPETAPPGTFPNETTGQPEPRRVILDSSYMTKADHSALWGWLNKNLTADELNRIVEVNTQLE